jgi:hypothetical protein
VAVLSSEWKEGQVTIHYKLPMPPDGKIKQEVGVLPTVTLGGAGGIRILGWVGGTGGRGRMVGWWSRGDSNPLPFDCRYGIIVHWKVEGGDLYGRNE